MEAIVPRIGYWIFPTRMIRLGWSFGDFLRWLPEHPTVMTAPLSEMRAYWRGRELERAWKPLIAGLGPEETVPEEWVVSAYPGRKRRYTYVVSYEALDPAGEPIPTQQVIVQSDAPLTRGDVLSAAQSFAFDMPAEYGYSATDFTIDYVEDTEFMR